MTGWNSTRITTKRLHLVAGNLDHCLAELESPERLGALLSTEVGPGWPPGEYDRDAQEFFRDCLQAGGADVVGWYGWYIIRREEPSVLVGAGGFLGFPDEFGETEMGFSMVEKWRNQGYATEMTQALILNAFEDPNVLKVIAHTTPDNAGSCKVLTKSGMRQTGIDEESGDLRFEIQRSELTTH